MKEDDTLEAELRVLRSARILFAHHSVGRDLLGGMQALAAGTREGAIRTLTLEEARRAPGPGLVDVSGGRNTDPGSKLEFFERTLEANPDLAPDVALLKLCYVDIDPSTDVEALFARYERTLRELARRFPSTRFGHVTTPLTRRPTDVRSRVKRLLGRMVWEDESNVRRHAYNERLREAFAADPIFDLAAVESTRPDGSRETFEREGGVHPALVPAYTHDGGHLNTLGARVAGRAMIRFLARTLESIACGDARSC